MVAKHWCISVSAENNVLLMLALLGYFNLKVIYHPLYGMNNYDLIWGDWLSCDLSEDHMIANHRI